VQKPVDCLVYTSYFGWVEVYASAFGAARHAARLWIKKMDIIKSLIEKAKKRPMRIVYPEGFDERIVVAAAKCAEMGIARPIVIGNEPDVKDVALRNNVSVEGLTIVPATDDGKLGKYAADYANSRGVKIGIAEKLVKKHLSFACMMVKMGDADCMVGGVASATASVIQSATLTVGFRKGLTTASSFFIMVIPEFEGEKDKVLIFADCAVSVAPTARQLAEIGIASGMNAKALLGIDPKIAFLSFSTKGSASHECVDKVVEALNIAKGMDAGATLEMDGELQGDSALVARVAAKKVKESPVAGKANVLIFPDLDAGNICYKLVQYLANARAYGPVLQGFAKPINDMSRGATVEDILGVSAITVVQAQNNQ
jgi:phosphate acetyltransferase